MRRKLLGGRQKQQNHSDNLTTMLGGMEMISGLAKAGAKAGTIGRVHLQANEQSHDFADVEWRRKTL